MNQQAMLSVPSLDLAGLRPEHVHALHLDAQLAVGLRRDSMSGSPKITNRLPLPVFFKSSAMCRSAFMRALSTGHAAQLLELRGVGLVVEGTGDKHVSNPASPASRAAATKSAR
jgi:hypothetical protein